MPFRPPIKTLVYGQTGARKSSFAKTFPKPLLVWQSDSHGKDMPYMRDSFNRALPESSIGPLQEWQIVTNPKEGSVINIKYRDIIHPDGLVRIEYYHDENPEEPHAFADWRMRRSLFWQEFNNWATVVADSLTQWEIAARLQHKYVLNPQADKEFKSRDPRKWFGGSTDDIEEALKVAFLSFPMNVVVIAHVDQDRDESAVMGITARNPMAPGRLRGTLAQQYSEMYYAYIYQDPGTKQRLGLLQTQTNSMFNAASQIGAPDPCYGHYDSLWENYDKEFTQ